MKLLGIFLGGYFSELLDLATQPAHSHKCASRALRNPHYVFFMLAPVVLTSELNVICIYLFPGDNQLR
jgi:hypothetical protein